MRLLIEIDLITDAFGLDQFDRLAEVNAVIQRLSDKAIGDFEVGASHILQDSYGTPVGIAKVTE